MAEDSYAFAEEAKILIDNAVASAVRENQVRTLIDSVVENAKEMAAASVAEDSDAFAEEAKILIDNAITSAVRENQVRTLIDSVVENAKEVVQDVIKSAFRRLETQMSEREKTCESLKSSQPSTASRCIHRDENFEFKDIGWLNIQEFSVKKAEENIHEFIKTWEHENSWLYCIDYIGEDIFPYDQRHRFRVRWSIPTRRKPVPRATASVYFTFVVSTIKPKNYPVDVFYVFETNRLVHKPGKSRFREEWLKDIIESKVALMSTITF